MRTGVGSAFHRLRNILAKTPAGMQAEIRDCYWALFDTETRRRAKVIGRFPGETSCISIVWAVLDRAFRGWRGLTMTPAGLRQLQDLRRSLLQPPRQLRPRTATASQPGDAAENVSTVG